MVAASIRWALPEHLAQPCGDFAYITLNDQCHTDQLIYKYMKNWLLLQFDNFDE